MNGSTPFYGPDLNAAGNVAFSSVVKDASNNFGSGVWVGTPGNLTLVAASGAQAPGLAAGDTFAPLSFGLSQFNPTLPPLLNDQGKVAIYGTVTGADITSNNNTGIWAGLPGQLSLVAQTGMHAPGTSAGVAFSSFLPLGSLPPLSLNSTGQVAFFANTTDGSGGIWGTDLAGHLQSVVHSGDTIQIAPRRSPHRRIGRLSGGTAAMPMDGLAASATMETWPSGPASLMAHQGCSFPTR